MKNAKNRNIKKLINIGNKIADRLNEIGISTEEELRHISATEAHRLIRNNYPDETLPVCYYLYSFEGALTDTHWNEIPENRKLELREEVYEAP